MSGFDRFLSCFVPTPSASARLNSLRVRTICALAPIVLGLAYLNIQHLLKPNFPFNMDLVVVGMDGVAIPTSRPTMAVTWSAFGPSKARGETGCNYWSGSVVVGRHEIRTISDGLYQTAMGCDYERTAAEEKFIKMWNSGMRWRMASGTLVMESEAGTLHVLRK